jgi:hypothetical protein
MSADAILKMTIKLKELKIAQLKCTLYTFKSKKTIVSSFEGPYVIIEGGLHFTCSLANAQAVSKTYVTVQYLADVIG